MVRVMGYTINTLWGECIMQITFNVRGLNKENCKVNIKTTDQRNWFNINGERRYEAGLTSAIYASYLIAFKKQGAKYGLGVR